MTSETIYETPILAHRITADEARMAATDFLLDHLGNQLVAGELPSGSCRCSSRTFTQACWAVSAL
jgi:hypothetical protein